MACLLVGLGLSESAPPAAAAGATGSLDLIDQTVDVPSEATWWARVRASGSEGTNTVVATVFEAVGDRDDYLDSTTGGPLGGAIARLSPVEVASDGGVVTVNLTPEERDRARMEAPGVYPVMLTLQDRVGTVLDELVTYAVLTDEDTAAMPVALVLPFGLTPRIAADGSSQLSSRDEQQLAVTVEALKSHPGTPATVTVTPETLVALESVGAQSLLADLADVLSDRRPSSNTFVDLQPASWFANGLSDDFASQLTAGEETVADLTGQTPQRGVWLADATLDPAAMVQLGGLGFTNFAIPDLTDEPGLLEIEGVTTPHAAISVDRQLAAHIGSTGDPVLDAHRVLTDLAVMSGQADRTAAAVIVPPADWTPSDPFLNALLDGLENSTTSEPLTLPGLFEDLPPAQATATAEPDRPAPLGNYPERLDEVTREVNGLASVMPEAGEFEALLRTVLLTSGAADLSIFEREAYLATVSDAVAAMTPVVTTATGQRVTMTGRTGVIPIGLDNQSGRPVRVAVLLRSDKLDFPDGSLVELELAEGVNQLEIPVTARTSGDSTLELDVLSPDQSLELSSTSVTVRSTALSGVGMVIAAVALLILLIWWIRNFRSGRRDKRLIDAAASPPHGSSPGPAD